MENGLDSGPEGFSPFGTPIANSTRSLLSPRPGSSSSNHSTGSSSISSSTRPILQRLKGKDLYGGPVTFGGGNASSFFRQRRERLLTASSPYGSASRFKNNGNHGNKNASSTPQLTSSTATAPSNDSNTPSSSINPGASSMSGADAMSSTAKLILDTLEKMSTPLRDARKIPVNSSADVSRAEKRKLIAEELESSLLSSPGMKKKRPNLRRAVSGGSSLNGPPVRSCFSPVLNRCKKETSEKKKVPAAVVPKEGLSWTEEKPSSSRDISAASSIEAFKSTMSHNTYEEPQSSAGGKLRIKDTAGPRSGVKLTQGNPLLPPVVKREQPTVPSSNGWPPPSSLTSKALTPVSSTTSPKAAPAVIPSGFSLPVLPPNSSISHTPLQPPPTLLAVKKGPASVPEKEKKDNSAAREEDDPLFTFSEPKQHQVPDSNKMSNEEPNDMLFTFSNPKVFVSEGNPLPSSSISSSMLMNGHHSSNSNINSKGGLPDITPLPFSIKSGNGRGGDLLGSKGILPDITTTPGQLKKGSVLSALSKMADHTTSKNARL